MINVKDHGASGDGISDDSVAIQDAIAYAKKRNDCDLYLPTGRYFIGTDPLILPSGFRLTGAGASSVIVSHGYIAISAENLGVGQASDITVRDMAIDCNGRGINGLVFGGVTGGLIDNVTVKGHLGYGIWLPRSLTFPTSRVRVSHCTVLDVADTGIELWGAQCCVVSGCYVRGTKATGGIYVWGGATDNVITGNIVEGDGADNRMFCYCVQPLKLGESIQTARNLFTSNIARNGYYGIRLTGTPENRAEDSIFRGNLIQNCYIGGTIRNCIRPTIGGNDFFNCGILFEVLQGMDSPDAAFLENRHYNCGQSIFPDSLAQPSGASASSSSSSIAATAQN